MERLENECKGTRKSCYDLPNYYDTRDCPLDLSDGIEDGRWYEGGDEDCRRVFDAFEDAAQSAGDHCDDGGWRHADDTDCPGLGAATDAAADATGCCDESGCAAYCECRSIVRSSWWQVGARAFSHV